MSNQNRSAFQGHPFHLVSPSPWPIFTCISLLNLTTSGVLTMHAFQNAGYWLLFALILVISSMFFWFRDVISEGTYIGNHTLAVQKGLNMGVALFIVSEALFFLAIFWAYFHSALSPTVELGAQWPPIGIEAINAFELPLLNTVLLLASGVTITYSHHSLIQGNRNGALYGALFTIILALIFTGFQGVEYSVSSFTLSDGAYGSCFYFGTGLIAAPIIPVSNYSSLFGVSDRTNYKLSPEWVTGFCDGESSFSIKIGKDLTRKHKIKISPSFSIELHKKDIAILYMIKTFFNAGSIIERVRHGKPSAIYSVQSVKILYENIIPHFYKYPLLTKKKIDFILLSHTVEIMYNTKTLEISHVNEILSYKSCMGKGKGLPSVLSNLFPGVNKLERSSIILPCDLKETIMSSLWLAGFVSAEGMFYIKPVNYKGILSKYTFVFSISQHIRDRDLFCKIKDFMACGVIETKKSRINEVVFCVYKYSDIIEKVIPFFLKNKIIGVKYKDFIDFYKAISIVEDKKNINKKKLNSAILFIKKGMNSKRKW